MTLSFSLARFSLEKTGVPTFCTSKLEVFIALCLCIAGGKWIKRQNELICIIKQTGWHTKKKLMALIPLIPKPKNSAAPCALLSLHPSHVASCSSSVNSLSELPVIKPSPRQVTFVSLCVPNTSQISSWADTHLYNTPVHMNNVMFWLCVCLATVGRTSRLIFHSSYESMLCPV